MREGERGRGREGEGEATKHTQRLRERGGACSLPEVVRCKIAVRTLYMSGCKGLKAIPGLGGEGYSRGNTSKSLSVYVWVQGSEGGAGGG